MKTNNKIPAYRFQGYTDAWELRKLGEVMEVTSVKRIHQSDWTDFGVRFLRARDIVAESKNESVSEPLFISQKKYDEYTAISGKVTKGDLLVTGVGTIGIPMLIEKNEPIYFKDGNIIWFKNENHIDGQFFYYSFIGKNIQSFIKESAGIGTVGTFTINTGKNTPIDLPILKKEQEDIGTFFSTLDRQITLHQRKLDTLKEQKKTYLKLLFPAKGQTKPALRFQGFEDDWEEARLGDLILSKSFKNFIRNPEGGGEFPVIQQGDIPIIGYSNGEPFKDFNSVVLFGDHTLSLFRPNTPFFVATDGVKILESKQFTGEFLYAILTNYRPESQGYKRHYTILKGTLISFTKNMKEQQAIGTFFQTLDREITQVEDKLASLKEMKKTLLRKLFV